MRNFVLGFVCGAAALYGSMSFHIVRADDGHHFLAKTGLTFRDSYVDIRQFGIAEWKDHVGLAEALQKANKQDLMKGAAENAIRNTLDRLWNNNEPQ
ncbi:MAG: hypothetical protein U1A77_13350 [Pirellulales bacterium]|jgi:hypothetical protein